MSQGTAQAKGYSLRQAEARAASALLAFEAAKSAHRVAEARQDELAQKISERRRGTTGLGRDRALEKLLSDSIAAQKTTEAKSRELEERALTVRQSIDEAFRIAASEFRRAKPLLRSKNKSEREEAKATILAIKALRTRLKEYQDSLVEGARSVPKDWERYDQKADANDGPEDLRAKADFVADNRDKFKKKRQQLLELIKQARQEQELARIASNFQQDAYLYDEGARSGRVSRGTASVLSARGTNNTANETTQNDSAPAPGNLGGNDEAPVEASGGSSGPAPAADPSSDFGAVSGGENRGTDGQQTTNPPPAVTDSTNKTPTGSSGSPAPSPASVLLPREFNPTALLNLQIDRLNASEVPLEQLIATLKNLEQLDELLAKRERELQVQAAKLEQAENKALGVQ